MIGPITRASDTSPFRRLPGDWRGWKLDRKARQLYTEEGGYTYHVDLDECTSSAQVLDWVCQIAGKLWADDATLAGFVRALNDVLHPQANLCSFGRGKRLAVRDVRSLVAQAREGNEWPRGGPLSATQSQDPGTPRGTGTE